MKTFLPAIVAAILVMPQLPVRFQQTGSPGACPSPTAFTLPTNPGPACSFLGEVCGGSTMCCTGRCNGMICQ